MPFDNNNIALWFSWHQITDCINAYLLNNTPTIPNHSGVMVIQNANTSLISTIWHKCSMVFTFYHLDIDVSDYQMSLSMYVYGIHIKSFTGKISGPCKKNSRAYLLWMAKPNTHTQKITYQPIFTYSMLCFCVNIPSVRSLFHYVWVITFHRELSTLLLIRAINSVPVWIISVSKKTSCDFAARVWDA